MMKLSDIPKSTQEIPQHKSTDQPKSFKNGYYVSVVNNILIFTGNILGCSIIGGVGGVLYDNNNEFKQRNVAIYTGALVGASVAIIATTIITGACKLYNYFKKEDVDIENNNLDNSEYIKLVYVENQNIETITDSEDLFLPRNKLSFNLNLDSTEEELINSNM